MKNVTFLSQIIYRMKTSDFKSGVRFKNPVCGKISWINNGYTVTVSMHLQYIQGQYR